MNGIIFQTYMDFLQKSYGQTMTEFILRDANVGSREDYETMGTYARTC
jgi:hypothetical protein